MKKSFWIFIAASTAYFILYGWGLGIPAEKIYDEVYQVTTAQQFLTLSGYTELAHPPLMMEIMAAFIAVLGDFPWVWRLASLLAGYGCLLLLFAVVRQWTQEIRPAVLAVILFALDGLHFTQSRIGMLNAGMLFWMLASLYVFCTYAVENRWPRRKALLISGICFGLAVCSRIVAAGTLGLMIIPALKMNREKPGELKRIVQDFFIWFMMPAVMTYFIPFVILPFLKGFSWKSILDFQIYMIHYHLTIAEGHTYASAWWSWPLMLRPIWYYFKSAPALGLSPDAGVIRGILCIGNPAVIWMLPLALFVGLRHAAKEKIGLHLFAASGMLLQWLQWLPVKRVIFFHYFHTAMPFGAPLIALMLNDWMKKKKGSRILCWGYLTVVIILFVYWYPLYTGKLISEAFFRNHLWFSSWV